MKTQLLILIAAIALTGCSGNPATNNQEKQQQTDCADPALQATVYHQTAAEMRALSYQAYNIARYRLDQSLRVAGLTNKQAVIVDIDETVLDNSPHQAQLILNDAAYPDYWAEWCNLAEAEPMPGALEFFKYAENKGVEIFYVSNRHDSLRQPTLKNLKSLGFPYANEEHLYLKTTTSSKVERRKAIEKGYHILFLMGDNLADFSGVFENGTIVERFQQTNLMKDAFGERFIVLPNAMYGTWDAAAINYSYAAPEQEKIEMKRQRLRGF